MVLRLLLHAARILAAWRRLGLTATFFRYRTFLPRFLLVAGALIQVRALGGEVELRGGNEVLVAAGVGAGADEDEPAGAAAARFHTALRPGVAGEADWQGTWIGGFTQLRASFGLPTGKAIASAAAYASGVGC
ncbi:MAG: hypothetical protein VXY90_14075, partial [Pseudomonadota bacterium]|nr:hypothetical protein [Pseudomonadota bacterium]